MPRVAKTMTLPAPVKGWYVYDNLADMPAGTAYLLENAFPGADYVRVRGGTLAYATSMGSSVTVNSLMVWTDGTTERLFAAANQYIYNVTGGGAVGAAVVTGLTVDAPWEHCLYTTASGTTYLTCMNGADTGRLYDGSSWAALAWTGVTQENLICPWVYKNRIYAIEDGTLKTWYLTADAIAGAATVLPLGGVFQLGGKLIVGATWSVDAGSGMDDKMVFITSEGEVAIYEGEYPGATNWSLIGLYRIGRPLGRRCVMKAGGDLALLTEDGIIPLSKAIQLDRSALRDAAITKNIQPEFRRAVKLREGNEDGWQILQWPAESLFLICTPKVVERQGEQLVANTTTGAWCRYVGWDAACFVVYRGDLYFGTKDGRVMQAETGGRDDGAPYTSTVFWAYSALKAQTNRKQLKMARVNVQASFQPQHRVTIRTDYNYTVPDGPNTSAAPPAGALWGTAVWGIDLWPSVSTAVYAQWRAVTGMGSMIAPVYQVTLGTSENIDLRVTSIDLLFEVGEVLG
jgi:hypothetical protein